MPVVKDYSGMAKGEELANLVRYSLPLFERQKEAPAQPNLVDKVKEGIANMNPNQVQNQNPQGQNYGPSQYNPLSDLVPYRWSGEIYLDRRIEAMHDFTDRVPGKHLHTFPSSGNEGLFGFTYLGDVHAWRRDDLIGTEFARMVDVHECIHTPDEYETRRITEWMMEREKPKYIK